MLQVVRSSVRVKLLGVVGLLGVVALTTGVLGITNMGSINDRLEHIVNISAQRAMLAGQIQQDLLAVHRAEKNLILSESEERMDEYAASLEGFEAAMLEKLGQLEEIASDQGKLQIEAFRSSYRQFQEISVAVRQASRKNTNARAFELSAGPGRESFDAAEVKLRAIALSNEAQANSLSESLQQTVDEADRAQVIELSKSAQRALISARLLQSLIALQRAEKNIILASAPEEMSRYSESIQELVSDVRAREAELSEMATAEGKVALEDFRVSFDAWLANNEQVRALSREASNTFARRTSSTEGRAAFEDAEAAMTTIAQSNTQSMDQDKASAAEAYSAARLMMLVSSLTGILAGLAIAFWIVSGIVAAVIAASRRVREIAQGDLTGEPLPVRSQDEVGQLTQALNEMSESLGEIVGSILDNSAQVAAAATEVSATSEEMSNNVDNQRTQLSQVAAALEELTASVAEVSEKSSSVTSQAEVSGQDAQRGGSIVKETVDNINDIASRVNQCSAAVSGLGQRAEAIGEIVDVINDIADQTNLLALNAAIEAARAGEHGRGFAVVADEVRKLADRTTKATEEIADSISQIQQDTQTAVERMVESEERVHAGVSHASEAGASLERIVASSMEVAGSIASIAAAAEQQAAASNQISSSVASVSGGAEEASRASSQAAAAATQLSQNAEGMRQLVERFKVRQTSPAQARSSAAHR